MGFETPKFEQLNTEKKSEVIEEEKEKLEAEEEEETTAEEEKRVKPRFVGTEAGLVDSRTADKVNNIVEKLNEKEIDSALGPILYPRLKERCNFALENLAITEEMHKDDLDWKEHINYLEKELEDANAKLEKYDKLRSKIVRGKELSADETGSLILYVKTGRNVLNEQSYSIKDKSSDEYKKSREQSIKMFASEIFLKRKGSMFSKKTTEREKESEKSKEKLEGEALFNQQIENNAHPEAKNIKTDVIFFLSSLDGHNIQSKLENYKEEIGEILYRQDIEYEAGKEIKISEKDREVLKPLLEFRKELDEWNTFSDPRVTDYRKRVFGYLKDTFGIEESKPKEGEKFNGKEQKAIQAVETNNKFLDKLIKKVGRPGYKINDELYNYSKEHFQTEDRERSDKIKKAKNSVSNEEFDRIYDEYAKWKKAHEIPQSINPAHVIIYKYNPEK